MHKYKETLANLNKLLKIEPNNASTLKDRGLIYCMMRKYKESLDDLNKSLEIEQQQNNSITLEYRGLTYYRMGRYEESHADLNRSLEIESRNAYIITGMDIFHMMRRYEEAFAIFNKSLKIEPNDTFELRNRGATFRVLGGYEEWLADYKEFEPNSECSLRNQRETCLKKYRYYYYKALEDLTKSLEIEPNNLGSLRIRGE